MDTAPGLSPCTQIESASMRTVLPSMACSGTFAHEIQHALGDQRFVVQHGTGQGARDQLALRRVRAVGKGFGHHVQARIARPLNQWRTGQRQRREVLVQFQHGGDHITRLALVLGNLVVQRAMRLHVLHRGAGGLCEALQRADLVDAAGDQVAAADVPVAAAETDEVGVGDMRAHDHVACLRFLQGLRMPAGSPA